MAGEIQRMQGSLDEREMSCIDGREGRPRATLCAMLEALAEGVPIRYRMCHHTVVDGYACPAFMARGRGARATKLPQLVVCRLNPRYV